MWLRSSSKNGLPCDSVHGRSRMTSIRSGCTWPAAWSRIARSELEAWAADPSQIVHSYGFRLLRTARSSRLAAASTARE